MDAASLTKLFPVLQTLGEKALKALIGEGSLVRREAGAILMRRGETCPHVPLVLSGVLRVYKLSPGGREMTLYRAEAGDTCLVSVACKLTRRGLPGHRAGGGGRRDVPHTGRRLPADAGGPLAVEGLRHHDAVQAPGRIASGARERDVRAGGQAPGRMAARARRRWGARRCASRTSRSPPSWGRRARSFSRMLGEMRHQGWLEMGRKRVTIADRGALEDLL